jgi:N-methylhydantoinase A/oxoprolinase/acetone carboxylase beta subunit
VTAFDAYIKPVVGRYLERMEQELAEDGVRTPLRSCSRAAASAPPPSPASVRCGSSCRAPAAGVIGSLEVGRAAQIEDLITVDIGGTSCDIALISRGQPLIRAEGEIGGYSVRVPMVDVNAIGAGGGSIAWIDGAGSLRVGPQSAGSEPGPACYDRGGERATVTDASIVLGYINPDYFAAVR